MTPRAAAPARPIHRWVIGTILVLSIGIGVWLHGIPEAKPPRENDGLLSSTIEGPRKVTKAEGQEGSTARGTNPAFMSDQLRTLAQVGDDGAVQVRGEVRFTTGEPVGDARVQLAITGQDDLSAVTSASGEFVVALPPGQTDGALMVRRDDIGVFWRRWARTDLRPVVIVDTICNVILHAHNADGLTVAGMQVEILQEYGHRNDTQLELNREGKTDASGQMRLRLCKGAEVWARGRLSGSNAEIWGPFRIVQDGQMLDCVVGRQCERRLRTIHSVTRLPVPGADLYFGDGWHLGKTDAMGQFVAPVTEGSTSPVFGWKPSLVSEPVVVGQEAAGEVYLLPSCQLKIAGGQLRRGDEVRWGVVRNGVYAWMFPMLVEASEGAASLDVLPESEIGVIVSRRKKITWESGLKSGVGGSVVNITMEEAIFCDMAVNVPSAREGAETEFAAAVVHDDGRVEGTWQKFTWSGRHGEVRLPRGNGLWRVTVDGTRVATGRAVFEEGEVITVVADEIASIRGRIRGDLECVVGVRAFGPIGRSPSWRDGVVEPSGGFVIDSVVLGEYSLVLCVRDATVMGGAQRRDVRPGGVETEFQVVANNGRLSGRVEGVAIGQTMRIHAYAEDGVAFYGTLRADGSFEVRVPKEGTFLVRLLDYDMGPEFGRVVAETARLKSGETSVVLREK